MEGGGRKCWYISHGGGKREGATEKWRGKDTGRRSVIINSRNRQNLKTQERPANIPFSLNSLVYLLFYPSYFLISSLFFVLCSFFTFFLSYFLLCSFSISFVLSFCFLLTPNPPTLGSVGFACGNCKQGHKRPTRVCCCRADKRHASLN